MGRNVIKTGDYVNNIFIIKKFEVRQSKNGKSYADITLGDMNGDYTAKLWDVPAGAEMLYGVNSFVRVEASTQTFNDSMQFVIKKITEVMPTSEELSEIVESAPYPPEKMYDKIMAIVSDFKNEDLKKLVSSIMEDHREQLMYYPAAKSFHHAIRGGLLYHMYTMLRSAFALLDIYDFLNEELVCSGVILHDIGKCTEITSTTYGAAGEYSAEGKLLGHITIGICEIDRKTAELGIDPEVSMVMKHMILSHHFYPEFGSPVAPMTAEAELLHHLDVIDARMYQFKKTLSTTEYGDFAEKVWILDKRSIYKPKFNKNDDGTEE